MLLLLYYLSFCTAMMVRMVSDFESFDTLRSFLDQKAKIKDEIEDAEDDEIVITCCGEYYDTIKERTMAYSYDSHSYAIGLIGID